jgi:eukaryotic-like serine/threonine-protein kinase
MSKEAKHFYEFGRFRLDPGKRLLLRDNQPVPLQPKAFETLLVLVQRSEAGVLQEDTMKDFWPHNLVEESNLTQHIFVLRKTLGETAGENRYIATVPGRGYQFAEKVRLVSEQEDIVVESHSVTQVVVDEQSSPDQLRPAYAWAWVGLAAVAVVALLGGAWYWRFHRAPKLTEKDTLVVADFENRTGDPVFDGTLKEAMAVDLGQSPYLNVISDQKINEALKLMSRDPGSRITGDVARDLCQRVNGNAVLQGSIANLGKQYVIVLTVTNCVTGDSLAAEQVRAESKERILPALDKAGSSLRGRLGESLGSIEKYDTPVEQATTPSLAALQAYSAGLKAWQGVGGNQAAIPFHQRAIELDRNFAMAYAHLGQCYDNLEVGDLALENMNKAFNLRDRVSERERFYIDSRYYIIATGEIEKAIQVLEQWRRVYPREWSPSFTLVVECRRIGRYEEAFREAKASMLLDPGVERNYYNLAFAALALNRLDEAQAALKEWQARNPVSDDWEQVEVLNTLAFLRDPAGMQKQSAWADVPTAAAYYGRFRRSREFTRRSIAEVNEAKEIASVRTAGIQINSAVWEALVGYSEQARREVTAALNLSRSDDVQGSAALALALAGDSGRAETITAELLKRYQLSTLFSRYWVPTIYAAIQLDHNNPAKAVQELEGTSRLELGSAMGPYTAPLFPVYMRGQAFLALHQGREAAAEFQKYIDHPGLVLNYPLGALARVGLARAYAMEGDTVKARAAYRDFFNLWKDADSDVPILKQAKAEYAKLE